MGLVLVLVGCGADVSSDLRPSTFEVVPAAWDFGEVTVGFSQTVNVQVVQRTSGALPLVLDDRPPFFFRADSEALVSGQNERVTVRFQPSVLERVRVSVGLFDDPAAPTLWLQGQGGRCRLDVVPAALDFGTVPLGQFGLQTFDVTNPSGSQVNARLDSGENFARCNSLAGGQVAFCAFLQDRVHDTNGGFVLAGQESIRIEVRYTPRVSPETETGAARVMVGPCLAEVPLMGRSP